MQTRDDYDRAFAVVRDVIHEWDPYGLVRSGAPEDEWDNEIARIVAKVPTIQTEDDAVNVVSQVFSKAFQPEGFSPTDCADVGQRLFTATKALHFTHSE